MKKTASKGKYSIYGRQVSDRNNLCTHKGHRLNNGRWNWKAFIASNIILLLYNGGDTKHSNAANGNSIQVFFSQTEEVTIGAYKQKVTGNLLGPHADIQK